MKKLIFLFLILFPLLAHAEEGWQDARMNVGVVGGGVAVAGCTEQWSCETVYSSSATGSATTDVINTHTYINAGQTINVCKIYLKLQREGDLTGLSWRIRIYVMNPSGYIHDGTPGSFTNVQGTSDSVDLSGISNSSLVWIEFNFSTPITIDTTNDSIGLERTDLSYNATNYVKWGINYTDVPCTGYGSQTYGYRRTYNADGTLASSNTSVAMLHEMWGQ